MTKAQLDSLTYFTTKDRYLSGGKIVLADLSFVTMRDLDRLRRLIGSPIQLIRGAHPNKPTAVDAWTPKASLGVVAMELTRLDGISYGIYSGNSFHIDRRYYDDVPARWLAIKPDEWERVAHLGMVKPDAVNGWLYLPWTHPRSFDALAIVIQLADAKRGPAVVNV